MSNFIKLISNTIKHWYLPLITGVIFIVLGIYVFGYPVESYVALSLVFSISFLVTGLMEVYFSISNRKILDNWGWSLVFGIVNAVIGVLLLMHPNISLNALPFYVGFMLMFRSITGLGYAFDLKNYGVPHWGRLMFMAVLGLIFSFILIWNPVFAGLTVVVWTALSLIMAGVYNIYVSLKLKKLKDTPKRISKELKEKFAAVKQEISEEIKKNSN